MATLEEFIQPHRRGSLTLSTILWPTVLCRAVPWDEKLFINEDVDFFGRALLAGYRIAGRPVGMMYIRQHEGERASTNPGAAGALAPALYRLKWTELLAGHPERDFIARRYLARQTNLTREALRRLVADEQEDPEAEEAERDAEESQVEEVASVERRLLHYSPVNHVANGYSRPVDQVSR